MSTNTISSASTLMRMTGLASGLDIDSIVQNLMKAQSYKVTGLEQKKQQVEWQQEDYRTVNDSLKALRDMAFNMQLQAPYLANKATSSNVAAVTATAGTAAAEGTYNITVNQLAQGVTKGSQAALPSATNADGTTKTLADQFGISGVVTFTLQGQTVGGTTKSQNFSIDTSTTNINQLVSTINSAGLGITASYDSANNRFFLTTNGTGSDYGINVTSDPGNFLSDATGSGSNTLNLLIQTNTQYSGQDAQFTFGDAQNMVSSSNTVTVAGITLNLNQAGGATSTITVSQDTDAIYNSIKAFVDQYNTTLDTINNMLAEPVYSDYLPLTDDQKANLSQEQQDQWTAKAKSGMLNNDPYLSSVYQKMRDIMSSIVPGISPVSVNGQTVTHNSLASIGIITGDYTENGKLHLNNNGDDLKSAIESDPSGIMQLFTDATEGISTQLYNMTDNAVSQIIDIAGDSSTYTIYDNSELGQSISDYDTKITDMNNQLNDLENQYYDQFTAMETAMSQMNAQMGFLSSLSGSNNK